MKMKAFSQKKTVYRWSWGSLFSTVDVSYLLLVGMVSLHLSPNIAGCCPPWCWWVLVFASCAFLSLCLNLFTTHLCSVCCFRLFALLFVLQLLWPFGLCLLVVPLASGFVDVVALWFGVIVIFFLNRFGSPLLFGCWHPSSLDTCLPCVLIAFLGIGWVGSAMCLWPLQVVPLVSLAYLLLLASWCLC